MKVLLCSINSSLPQEIKDSYIAKISKEKIENEGFILDNSFSHPQRKLFHDQSLIRIFMSAPDGYLNSIFSQVSGILNFN